MNAIKVNSIVEHKFDRSWVGVVVWVHDDIYQVRWTYHTSNESCSLDELVWVAD